MYHAGRAPIVLVAQPKLTLSDNLLSAPTESEVIIAILKSKGVPASQIKVFGKDVTSTREEAAGLKQWIASEHVGSILIPTDPFHTRRAKWIFNRSLEGTGVQVFVSSVPHPGYSEDAWWKSEEGLISFQNEVIKSLYYMICY